MSFHYGCGFEVKSKQIAALKFNIMSNKSREFHKHTQHTQLTKKKGKLSSAHIKAFTAASDSCEYCKAFLIMIIGYVLQELLIINVITLVFSTPLWLLC